MSLQRPQQHTRCGEKAAKEEEEERRQSQGRWGINAALEAVEETAEEWEDMEVISNSGVKRGNGY